MTSATSIRGAEPQQQGSEQLTQLTPQPSASQDLSPTGLLTLTGRDPQGCHIQTAGKIHGIKDPRQINNTRRGLTHPEAKRHITEMPEQAGG